MRIFQALADARPTDVAMIDSSAVKAQRASAGGKGVSVHSRLPCGARS
jgi:hypothetical protein